MKSHRAHFSIMALSALFALNLATPSALARTDPSPTSNKSETVYVSLDPTGSVSRISVRDLLENKDKSERLQDVSELTNIKPSDDSVSMASQSGNALEWNAGGEEVQYRGTSSQELPVSCAMSFTLNGQSIAAKDLVDKSGRVTIRLDFTNHDAHEVVIDGKQETIYTPFVVMSILSLKNDVFTNVQVTGGRMMEGSEKTTVIGMSFPGLQESLAVEEETVDIPTSLTVEADVSHFELGQIVSIITPELLSDLDTQKLDTSEITDARNKLSEAMDNLMQGTNELRDSMQQLAEGQEALGEGINQFADTLTGLPDAAQQLASGASGLANASSSAAKGARELSGASDDVAGGVAQLDEGIAGSTEGMQVVEATLQDALEQLELASQETSKQDDSSLTSTIAGLKTMLSASGLSVSERETLKAALAHLEGEQATQRQSPNLSQALALAKYDVIAAQEGCSQISDGLGATQEGLKAARQGAEGVSQGAGELAYGLDQLEDGSCQLSISLSEFGEALPQLASGAAELKQGSDQLVSGAKAIARGTSSLAEGVSELNEQGIKKIVDKIDESGLTLLSDRLDALSQAASAYQNFSGLAEDQQGSVTFFYKTDAIGE
ncbi:MAG: hypothetical protein Q4B54_06185 [Coriobacteriales bacterium]|nr:hypothetical protein [Coriobacteriales bacterium]